MIPSRRSRSPGVDAEAVEALVGARQQPAQHELGDRHLPHARPVDARVDAVARPDVEVLLGRRERHLRPQRPVLLDQRPARGRSRRRRWRGCRRPSARRAGCGSRRAGAGGRARRRRSGGSSGRSCRCAGAARRSSGMSPRVERLDRVLVLAHRQQRREVADVLLEEVEDRRDPALAEPHARAHALGLELLGPRVGGLLEERDARLAPQLLAEEERRVGGRPRPARRRSPARRSSARRTRRARPAGAAGRSCTRPRARSCRRRSTGARRRGCRSRGPRRARRRSAR